MVSVPKNLQVAARCTYALAVGFVNPDGSFALQPNSAIPLSTRGATAVAIDPYHLLSAAHSFELDISQYKTLNPATLRYRSVSFNSLC